MLSRTPLSAMVQNYCCWSEHLGKILVMMIMMMIPLTIVTSSTIKPLGTLACIHISTIYTKTIITAGIRIAIINICNEQVNTYVFLTTNSMS